MLELSIYLVCLDQPYILDITESDLSIPLHTLWMLEIGIFGFTKISMLFFSNCCILAIHHPK